MSIHGKAPIISTKQNDPQEKHKSPRGGGFSVACTPRSSFVLVALSGSVDGNADMTDLLFCLTVRIAWTYLTGPRSTVARWRRPPHRKSVCVRAQCNQLNLC